MKKLTVGIKPFLIGYGIWGGLGFYRGMEYYCKKYYIENKIYNNDSKYYKKPQFYYLSCLGNSIFYLGMYMFPVTLPLQVVNELFRFERYIRNIQDDNE